MKTTNITVTHEGWFLFCPVWLGRLDAPDLDAIPKRGCGLLFEAALVVQQAVNWCVGHIEQEAGGFVFHGINKLETPKTITARHHDET